MARTVRTVSVNMEARAAQYMADMDKSAAKTRQLGGAIHEVGHKGVTDLLATSTAMRMLEKTTADNLRMAERWLVSWKHGMEAGTATAVFFGAKALAGTEAVAAHGTAVDGVANSYRAARFAFSPTMFTGITLAAGIATEMLAKATIAQDKFIERQAVLAVRNNLDIDTQRSLTMIGARQGFDFTAAYKASGAGSLEDFGALIAQLGNIKDPADRALQTMQTFGNELGEQILPKLGDRFAENERRIREWGIGIDSVDRENIATFSSDMRNLRDFFTETSDSIVLASKKIETGFINMFAAGYAGLRGGAVAVRKGIKEHPFSQAGDLPDSGMAFFEDSMDMAEARRLIQERAAGTMTAPRLEYERHLEPVSSAFNKEGERARDLAGLNTKFETLRSFLFDQNGDFKTNANNLIPGMRGTAEDAFVSTGNRIEAIKAEIKAEEEAKKAAEQSAATFKAIQAQVRGLQRDAILAGKTGLEASDIRRGFTLSDMRTAGATPAQLASAGTALNQTRMVEVAGIIERFRNVGAHSLDGKVESIESDNRKAQAIENTGFLKELGRQFKDLQDAGKYLEKAVSLNRAIGEQKSEGALRIAGILDTGPNAGLRAATAEAAVRKAAIQDRYQYEMGLVAAEEKYITDAEERRQELRLSYEKDIGEIEIRMAEEVARYQRQKFDEIKSVTERLLVTLETKPSQFGKQLLETMRAAALKPINDGLSNAVSQRITPLIFGKDGSSGISGVLHGVFGKQLGGAPKDSVFGGGWQGGGIFSLFSKLLGKGKSAVAGLSDADFGGWLAGGGSVEPGKVYGVGESGKELFAPQTAGTVIPNGEWGGTTIVNNSIDARGADLGVMNRLARAQERMSRASVAASVRANHERSRRTPA